MNAGRSTAGAGEVPLAENQRGHGAWQDRPEGIEGSAWWSDLASKVFWGLHLKVTVHGQEVGDERHFLITGAADGARHAHQDGDNELAQNVCK